MPPNPPKEELSLYYTMLESAPPVYLTNLEGAIHNLPPEYPVYYFFYGTLKRTIDLPEEEEPKLRPAKVIGYALAKWGESPALIDGEQGQVVFGSAWLVKDEEQAQNLAYYEKRAYMAFPCRVRFADDEMPEVVSGRTFMYAGDQPALLEQWFDRKLWALQMIVGWVRAIVTAK